MAWLARAPAEIAAPSPSTTVIYAALGADLVGRSTGATSMWEIWAAMSFAVVLMGILLLLAGSLRLAGFIKFMPSPVSAGFVTGIGLLVIWSQLGPILGVQLRGWKLYDLWSQIKPGSVIVAECYHAELGHIHIVASPSLRRPARTAGHHECSRDGRVGRQFVGTAF